MKYTINKQLILESDQSIDIKLYHYSNQKFDKGSI